MDFHLYLPVRAIQIHMTEDVVFRFGPFRWRLSVEEAEELKELLSAWLDEFDEENNAYSAWLAEQEAETSE